MNQSTTMARLGAVLLMSLSLMLGLASRSAAQIEGFHSINCGGEDFIDPTTKIIWKKDPFNEFGKAGRINASLPNVTTVMKSLQYFPNDSPEKRKYCYHFQVSIGETYLLRASFLYGNYDGLNQPPTFVLILNQDVWRNVTILHSTDPVVHELIFSNHDVEMNICLASQLNSTKIPFISTLEIRPLNRSMYIQAEGALSIGYGLLLWQRINYGATTQDAIRYPEDPYDRIWEANTRGPKLESKNTSSNYTNDLSQPPAAVMATAITSIRNLNLSFVYPGYGGTLGFRMDLHFQELDAPGSPPRLMSISFPNSGPGTLGLVLLSDRTPQPVVIDQQAQLPANFEIALIPASASPLGSLLNAIELFHWTPQPLSDGTSKNDVDAIKEVQAQFKLSQFGQGDPCLPEDYKWIWIKCSTDNPRRIMQINLSSFNLSGEIPLAIKNLTTLEKIDLSNNKLSGDIPDFGSLLDLKYLDLHSNNLTGEISPSLVFLSNLAQLDVSNNNLCGNPPSFQLSINLTYKGNKRLCENITCSCSSSTTSNFSMTSNLPKKKNKKRKYTVSIFSLGAFYILSILAFLFLYIYKARRSNQRKSTKSLSLELLGQKGDVDLKDLSFVSKMFTYKEIMDATLNFTKILGEGGFGKVYHGLLPDGEAIAVKMLANASKQGLKEFFNEVAVLSKVRHKNLVSLLGFCVENTFMLIYEYIEKGNIRDLIYGDRESIDKPLPWTIRLHVALDASQGLDYLHTGCDPTIFHRDVKSTNILLSEKMQAKVADFGLSRLKEGDNTTSHVSTVNVVGTMGYLDPAYNATNQLTDKSDVYSFGIVLLELICGRAPIDMFKTPPHIAEWASESVAQGKVGKIVDPMLANGYKMESLCKALDVALQCVDDDRAKRPKMSEVSQLLQNALEIEMDPNHSSQDFNGSFST